MTSCEKIVHQTFRITSRYRHQQIFPLGHFSKNHSRPSALASALFLSFGARCRSDARGHGLFEARLPRARPLEVREAAGLDPQPQRVPFIYTTTSREPGCRVLGMVGKVYTPNANQERFFQCTVPVFGISTREILVNTKEILRLFR